MTCARQIAQEQALDLWESLDNAARWQLGDDLVLGCFDWRDWFEDKPAPGALAALDRLRMDWEA